MTSTSVKKPPFVFGSLFSSFLLFSVYFSLLPLSSAAARRGKWYYLY